MKVLLSAYACQPGEGSEPSVGWNTVVEAAKSHDVWVLTRRNNQSAIETELARNPIANLHFVYLDVFNWTRRWKPGEVGKTVRIHYYLWQVRAYFAARSLHRQIGFDLMHHVTYVQYSDPSFLALFPVPFIWGPVGGGESAPKSFRSTFDKRAQRYETLRDISRWVGEADPFVRLTAKRSAIALATTQDTAERLHALNAPRVKVVGQCGLSRAEIETLGRLPAPPAAPTRFVSIGRFLHWKGFDLGLEAFARAQIEGSEYWMVGDGVEGDRLQSLAVSLGIGNRVKWWGKLSRDKTLATLGDCHVLVHPSLHDSGGFVILEAMAAARPVICLDLGGPATQVTQATGYKIPAIDRDLAIDDLACAMKRLAADRAGLAQMGQAGQSRVKMHYDWSAKGQFVTELYERVFACQSEPDPKVPAGSNIG
ncbi:glycosyltransferase family 4 protein [Oscillatoriales cyanobacterium LEGE 11467]|uniref:Glycosyltransferase family 4 protein n=1 Tax=Zarconia navalis LEGE 11467 TaxID=1828826 RepID=A0A928Z8W7_9CYAN|nr:glycosyltransferase family 4 protein [Zarconia navalis]MBE9041108.1 glycosyltransferase family 4 protein [Zarconia navalis LEGE 11467]